MFDNTTETEESRLSKMTPTERAEEVNAMMAEKKAKADKQAEVDASLRANTVQVLIDTIALRTNKLDSTLDTLGVLDLSGRQRVEDTMDASTMNDILEQLDRIDRPLANSLHNAIAHASWEGVTL